jgi:hypothetical protein
MTCSIIKLVANFDDLVENHEFNYRWLNEKVHIQGVVFFQEQGHTM